MTSPSAPAVDKLALRRMAGEATPGPWHHVEHVEGYGAIVQFTHNTLTGPAKWVADARFVAAANPSVILALLDQLEAAEKANEWQDISTAPKDGTYILGFPALAGEPLVVVWERPVDTPPMMRAKGENIDHDGFWRMAMSMKPSPYQPTLWRPLPHPSYPRS